MTPQLQLTTAALNKIKEILAEENNPNTKLRVFVQGGGCSGFNYGFSLEEELVEDDINVGTLDAPVVVDPMSMQYLVGATINYKEELMGANFVIDNPNATSTCGCGSSFGI